MLRLVKSLPTLSGFRSVDNFGEVDYIDGHTDNGIDSEYFYLIFTQIQSKCFDVSLDVDTFVL